MEWLSAAKLAFGLGFMQYFFGTKMVSALGSGLLGQHIPPEPYAGTSLFAISAVCALIHIAGKK